MTETKYLTTRHLRTDEIQRLGIEDKILQSVPSFNYDGNGTKFYDRLDIGRAIYQKKGFSSNGPERSGLNLERYFTNGNTNPFDTVGNYEPRKVEIRDDKGKLKFELDGEFPKSWSESAATVVANKYFYRPEKKDWKNKIEKVTGRPHEYSPVHLFSRVTKFFSEWGEKLGYFATPEDRKIFEDELNFLQAKQMFAFNSPVYFNAGLNEAYGITGSPGINYVRDPKTEKVTKIEDGCYVRPQLHACFIKGPQDNLESILDHVKTEGGIFSNGSGIGQNLELRGEGEPLSSGGVSSGPMSFFKLFDDAAGTIKSGGKSRRAARMTTMKYTHPDIIKFIEGKVREDYKALLLMRAGLSAGFEGEAYNSVTYQNTNLSVRVDDHFFDQVESNGEVELKFIKSGEVARRANARRMLQEIAFGSWRIGDPAIQYESEIQRMHTCKNSGPINSSNPCSEYMFLDDSACNLGSINLIKFADLKGNFDVEKFKHAIKVVMKAHDIANDAGSYPNYDIAKTSPEFRTIGLGYANLGALLMRKGLPYDSDKARAFAGAVTAIMNAQAYIESTEMARDLGTFVHYEFNKEPMMDVMKKHTEALDKIDWETLDDKLLKDAAYQAHQELLEKGEKYGFRNAQATVIAPTGTIAFLMDCDTTGIEPAIALKIKKNLSGGGNLTLVNKEVHNALINLGYDSRILEEIEDFIKEKNEVVGAPHLSPDHYAVFDTAFSPTSNGRTVSFQGHVKMVAAAQPFISGAISKTNNLPEWATVKDIYDGYLLGHKLGLKAVAVYRYNSKPATVYNFGVGNPFRELKRGEKRELSSQRDGPRVEVDISGSKYHIATGEYDDGTVGELFIETAKSGSTMNGLLNNFAILASTALKRGVRLEDLVRKFVGQEFEPNGLTNHPHIRVTKSPIDFAFRWLAVEYLGKTEYADNPDLIDTKKLRGFKTGAMKIYQRQDIDDWEVDQVLADSILGGFVNDRSLTLPVSPNKSTKIDNGNRNKKEQSGRVCNNCGSLMIPIKANCWECHNCFEQVGGCG